MFDKMKYIILDSTSRGPRPFIFAETETHNEFVARVKNMDEIVVGAGFVQIHYQNRALECFGRSVSLDVKSRPEDSNLINRLLGVDVST